VSVATTESWTESFGVLLRRHRLAASLSQEVLGERARLSANAIAALERGRRTAPRSATVVQLAGALGLTKTDRGTLIAAAARARAINLADRNGPALAWSRNNLPFSPTSFVARAGEMAQVTEGLRAHRLLTITGSGGCGKTRLALEVARELVSEFADGVWLVELAPLADAALVPQTIANTIGIRDEVGRPFLEVLSEYLRSRHVLLILDTCEHLIDACAQVADTLLRTCADVRLIATSRELLGVAGEAPWRVKSMSVVDPQSQSEGSQDWAATVLAS
jgi:transcriptional regulator with XRE-family HTH domain